MDIHVHEYQPGSFARWPSGYPVMKTFRTATRFDGTEAEIESYEAEIRGLDAYLRTYSAEEKADMKIFIVGEFFEPTDGKIVDPTSERFERDAETGIIRQLFDEIDPPPPEPLPVPDLVAYAAERRWRREVSGCLWNGWPVHTDRDSQTKIMAERLAIEAGERVSPDGWKFADGVFRMVSNEDFIALAATVREHVRSVFRIEAGLLVAISAEEITTAEEIDEAFS